MLSKIKEKNKEEMALAHPLAKVRDGSKSPTSVPYHCVRTWTLPWVWRRRHTCMKLELCHTVKVSIKLIKMTPFMKVASLLIWARTLGPCLFHTWFLYPYNLSLLLSFIYVKPKQHILPWKNLYFLSRYMMSRLMWRSILEATQY